eukprot:965373-Amphidinium_carterae.1
MSPNVARILRFDDAPQARFCFLLQLVVLHTQAMKEIPYLYSGFGLGIRAWRVVGNRVASGEATPNIQLHGADQSPPPAALAEAAVHTRMASQKSSGSSLLDSRTLLDNFLCGECSSQRVNALEAAAIEEAGSPVSDSENKVLLGGTWRDQSVAAAEPEMSPKSNR